MGMREIPKGFREITGFLFSGYRCSSPGRNTDLSRPSIEEVKNEWSFTTTPTICLCDGDKESFIFLHGVLELIVLVYYHYHRHPKVDLPQVLTVSGLIPKVHILIFNLCDLEFFRSFGRYFVLCANVELNWFYVSKSCVILVLYLCFSVCNSLRLKNISPSHTDRLVT